MGVDLGLLKALCGQTWNSYDLLQGLSCPLRTTWGGVVVFADHISELMGLGVCPGKH